MWLRRGLVLAGLLAVGWAVARVGALWAGADWVVGDDDPHGYFAIFSLLLLPFLAVAAVLLAVDVRELWRSGRGGRIGSGVALALSAPLAGPLAIPAAAVGVAIVVVAAADGAQRRRRTSGGMPEVRRRPR
jgi:hypothetical protein